MKISYTGKSEEIPQRQRTKLEAKLQKLSKIVEHRGEKEAHVVLTQQRFLHKVEITMHAWDHALVGIATNGDITAAAQEAFERLEKQLLKLRARWRDTTRVRDKEADGEKASATLHPPPPAATSKRAKKAKVAGISKEPVSAKKAARKQVYRVNSSDGNKPMTLEEAMLEIEASQDYLVYRDAQTDRVTVLMRRSDGHFDLIES
ncbi:MAG TPA: ribosome-associated translation inhibitor RaiA [Bryobacteraceae bacterium]|jgi:putative sigma-54 modulation protein|nr:ribosome-associated translation inhibitor RaiA [Bryobacteraceae bacterium]